MPNPRQDVIIVGAGAAGLAAADALRRAGIGLVVLEARDRIGGRVDSRIDPTLGVAVERGAEFVHGRPPHVTRLARRSGASLRSVPDRHVARRVGRLSSVNGAFQAAQRLLALGGRDDETFEAALRRHGGARRLGAGAVQMAREFVRGFYLADPARASARALREMTEGLGDTGGEAPHRVLGGYLRILDPLARALRAHGALRLGCAVEEIRWRPGKVEVRARGAAGGRLAPMRAARAIVTVPIGVLRAGALRFRPAPSGIVRALAALEMGPVVKVILRFRGPLWETRGARTLSFLHVPGAPVPVFWTLAPLSAPVLVGWAGGPHARALAGRGAPAIAAAALTSAARGLALPPGAVEDALDGIDAVDWTADPFACGGYAVFPAGSGGASETLGRPVADTLFFAGEAAADPGGAGTVEGALATGERAAREVIRSLRRAAGSA